MGWVQKNMLSQKMCADISSHCTVPRMPGTGLAPMVAALPAAVTMSARERRQRNAFRESDSPLYLRQTDTYEQHRQLKLSPSASRRRVASVMCDCQ